VKDRSLIILSLVLSVSALGYAAWLHHRADAFATDAPRHRETELVRAWAPKFDQMYRDMFPDLKSRPQTPTTLAELFDPLIRLMEHVGDVNEPTNVPPKKASGQ
jgi:hypothetical protein